MMTMIERSVSRRAFVRGALGLAVTGAAGCAGLPVLTRPRRDDTLVAFLSDCHVGNWGRSPKYQGEKLTACIARVLRLDPLPGKMIIAGDLAYLWGHREDYELARQLLQPVADAGIAVTIGMGNHDRRENFLACWPEYAQLSPVRDRIVRVVEGVHCDYVVIDTLIEPPETDRWITPGRLDGEQREWLKAHCAAAKRPFFVIAHHPADELGDPEGGGKTTRPRVFGDLIMGPKEAPTKCLGFIHGHDHAWYVTRGLRPWSERRVGHTVCLPSTGHWGDIGYALLRESSAGAELSLVQYDYFAPAPPKPGERHPAWEAIVRDNDGAHCTFVAS